jgi:hypothetical protein
MADDRLGLLSPDQPDECAGFAPLGFGVSIAVQAPRVHKVNADEAVSPVVFVVNEGACTIPGRRSRTRRP